jgi:broad specificity phosphatase PhoE
MRGVAEHPPVSSLLLVRHGQASAFGPDYDVLSSVGAEQSRMLGARWARDHAAGGRGIDALYQGPHRRHAQTAEHLRAGAADAGLTLPEPETIDELAEIDMSRLLAEAMSRVLPSCPDLVEQQMSGKLDDGAKAARKHVMGIFAKMLERWAQGEGFEGVEDFAPFVARARTGLTKIMRAQGRNKRVGVFTSGGPITASLTTALNLDPDKAAEMMLVTVNASVTELMFTEDRLTLRSYNDHAHLPASLVTRI